VDLFPDIKARSLTGREFSLPGELPAMRTVVIAAFQQPQQALVDRWIDALVDEGLPATPLGLEDDSPTAIIELPVLPSRYRFTRRFIDGGMARSIKLEPILARTWTTYSDPEAFREALSIPSPRVTVMVVTKLGEVTERASGEPTDADVKRIATVALSGSH
jgi:hypothetical protein